MELLLANLRKANRLRKGKAGARAFTSFEDLKSIDVSTRVMHGDDDQIVPIADSALFSAKLLKNGTLKVYQGCSHGMCTTNADVINADLLAFVKGRALSAGASGNAGEADGKTIQFNKAPPLENYSSFWRRLTSASNPLPDWF
jgi:dienelactone hydrolase